MKSLIRYLYALLVVSGLFTSSCQHDPITVTDIIHIDTTSIDTSCGIPTGLYASSVTSASATLNWSPVNDATTYNVQYKSASNSFWTSTATSLNALPLLGLLPNTSYEFKVQSICSSGSSAFSETATFLTDTSNNDTTAYIPCDPDTAYFQNDVLPIFLTNCAMPGQGCHDATSHAEGLVLDSYDNIMASGKVKPGNPGNSKIYKVLIETDPGDRMPPAPYGPLTADEINLIYTWILQGALNNYCGGGPCDTLGTTFSGTVFPILQTNCTGCHSGNVISGGVDLSDYSNVYTQVVNGKLFGSVNQLPGYVAMPLGSVLSDCDIRKINFWINDGAPNN